MLGVAFGSSALSLGRTRGSVVLGQPLDIAVDVRIDSAEDAIAQCFEADVYHADSLVDRNRIRIIVQALGASPQDIVVRVRSSAAVDEPVMSVVLRSVCGQRGTRRYDFLTEFPVETTSASAPVVISDVPAAAGASATPQSAGGAVTALPIPAPAPAPAPARPAPPPAPAAEPVRAPVATQPRRAPVVRPPRPPAPRPQAALKQAPPPAKAAAARADSQTAGRPRLRLEAPAEQPSALRGSTQLSVPTENLPQRAEAAATWRALNAAPEDVLRESQRLQALEVQDKSARDARSKAESELRARLERAERRLDEAENNRLDVTVVYGLLALLLAALLAAVHFWSRARKSAAEVAHWARNPDSAYVNSASPPSASRSVGKASMTEELSDESVNESLFEGLKKAPTSGAAALTATAAAGAAAGAAVVATAAAASQKERASDAAHLRAISPEEFFDVQQHADFFVSLGQYDQAIDVLRKHIDEHAEMSPLAFLELFKIYHTLSRQSDYNALREEFHGLFNGRMPSFAAFSDEGLSLEDYPAALLSIETAWGDPRVLDTIEANLFRHPGDTGKPFDLAAYRDLLLLYAVAKTLLRKGEGDSSLSERGGRGLRASEDDAAFLPQRLTRPDFSAAQHGRTYPVHPATAAPAPAPVSRPEPVLEPELDSVPAPLSSTPSYDQGLVLDLDLSDSELQELEASGPAPIARTAPTKSVDEVDIDLPLFEMDEPSTEETPRPAVRSEEPAVRKAPVDSGLIDFDLFDPNTEARIAPKSTR